MLSVVIPNYNQGHFLPRCLDALLIQSKKADEILIVDDASTDESLDTITHYQKHHPTIHYIQNTSRLGPIPTINKGIDRIQGDFVALCAADDIMLPEFFQLAYTAFNKYPDIGLCCGEVSEFQDNQLPKFAKKTMLPTKTLTCISSLDLPSILLKTPFFIHTTATIYRREYLLRYGKLQEGLKSVADWYLNYQIAFRHGVCYIPKTCGAFYINPQSYSQKFKKSALRSEMYNSLIKQIKQEGQTWHDFFVKTGLLSQIGIRMISFLAMRCYYWYFLPRAFIKKCHLYWHRKRS